ncbi:MAG: LapA family protein [Burkholderiaceae bacterium]
MKYLMWLLKAAIFFVLFAFALNNQETVTLNWFFGARSQAPMVVLLLLTLISGVMLGIAVMLPLWWRARHDKGTGRISAAAQPNPGTSELAALPAPDIEPPTKAKHPAHGL